MLDMDELLQHHAAATAPFNEGRYVIYGNNCAHYRRIANGQPAWDVLAKATTWKTREAAQAYIDKQDAGPCSVRRKNTDGTAS